MTRPILLIACLLLTACASSPQLGAGAIVTLDRCGQPVVVTRVEAVQAGGGYLADTEVRVYKRCELGQPEED